MMEIKANYSLLFENLLDTSHISFLHIGGIDGGNMATAPYTVSTEGVIVTFWNAIWLVTWQCPAQRNCSPCLSGRYSAGACVRKASCPICT